MHDLRQQRYYWWIFVGSMALIFNAGYINAIAIITQFSKAVTHMTGNVTQLGVQLMHGNFIEVYEYVALIIFFILGAIISGVFISEVKFSVSSNYTPILLLQTLLLVIAWYFLSQEYKTSFYLSGYMIATAAGMQNAMVTKFSGAVIRTTHVTGILTDLGIELGHLFRRDQSASLWKIKFFLFSVSFFLLGGMVGVHVYKKLAYRAMLCPTILTLGLAVILKSMRYYLQKKTEGSSIVNN